MNPYSSNSGIVEGADGVYRREPTLSQYRATAKFHRRMEKAYTSVGRTKDAGAARKAAEMLEAKVKELVSRETP